jgi:putative flippase GtrA
MSIMERTSSLPLLQFVKFVAVGVLNTAWGYGLFAFLIFIDLHFTVASFLSMVLGILFNYFTSGKLVFANTSSKAFLRYWIMYGGLYLWGIAWLWLLMQIGFSAYTAGALMLAPNALISFFLQKRFVFAP